MHARRAAVSIASAFLAFLSCPGCGGESAGFSTQTVPVKGRITYKGRPLTRGAVTFEPEGAGREAHGEIQPDGTFTLTTYTKGDGAVGGAHRVAVSAGSTAGKAAVPVKYQNFSSSKVQVEVDGSRAEYPIDLP